MGPQLGPVPKPAVKGRSRRDSLEDFLFLGEHKCHVCSCMLVQWGIKSCHGIGSQSDGLLIEGT